MIKPQDAKGMLQPARDLNRANMYDSKANNRPLFQNIPLDLSVAATRENPYAVNFPFRSLYMMNVPNGVEIYFKPNFRGSGQQWMKLVSGDVIGFDLAISGGYLSWEAQAGVEIEILAFLEVVFQSGRIISQNAGGVSISDGSSFTVDSNISVPPATATLVVDVNASRNTALIENHSGYDAFFGGAAVDNNVSRGIKVANGGFFEWRNSAALYVYIDLGGALTVMESEN